MKILTDIMEILYKSVKICSICVISVLFNNLFL
jgi:hypothetical protein